MHIFFIVLTIFTGQSLPNCFFRSQGVESKKKNGNRRSRDDLRVSKKATAREPWLFASSTG
jgi:hypothetical protein